MEAGSARCTGCSAQCCQRTDRRVHPATAEAADEAPPTSTSSQPLLGEQRAHHHTGGQRQPRQQPLLEALLRPPALGRRVLAEDLGKTFLERKERERSVSVVYTLTTSRNKKPNHSHSFSQVASTAGKVSGQQPHQQGAPQRPRSRKIPAGEITCRNVSRANEQRSKSNLPSLNDTQHVTLGFGFFF